MPAVSGDRFPANNALHLPPDCRGCSWKFWLAEPGTQYQPDLHRAAGKRTKVLHSKFVWSAFYAQQLDTRK